ncbi:MAG: glycerol-3-phosphate 1-O-acyltransferase PlsY [Candidatus Sulfotelmatobacter sp.]
MSSFLLIAAASYLLGSIPFGYLLVRMFHGEDVRKTGSGNIGATNVARKSPVLGVVTLLLDALKGSAAVLAALVLLRGEFTSWAYTNAPWYPDHAWTPLPDAAQARVVTSMALAALFAIAGHMFPVWLKFHGGKGVATGLGSFLLIAPKAVLVAAGIFFLVVLAFRYVSLASIIAVAAFPSLAWLFREYGNSLPALAFMSSASLLIVVRHRQNIRRLLAGTENRFGSKRAARPESRPE